MQVEYCPTDEMIANYMTKPLIIFKFIQSRTASWMQNDLHGWSTEVCWSVYKNYQKTQKNKNKVQGKLN